MRIGKKRKVYYDNIHIDKYKQKRQFACKVILRRVRVTIVAVGKQELLHMLSVCL
jgi:hypothetical protein